MLTIPLLAALLAFQGPQIEAERITIERHLTLKHPGEVQVAPDGATVAFTLTQADPSANVYRHVLHTWDDDEGTGPAASDVVDARRPRWSPDGATLAFLSADVAGSAGDQPAQIWLLPRSGGGLTTQLSDLPAGVIEYEWAPDGSLYVLTSNESGGGREFWRIQVADGAAEYVWGGDAGIRDMAVSPDGGAIAFSTNESGDLADYLNYDVYVLDLESKQARALTSRAGSDMAPIWSPDGSALVFRARQDSRYPYSQIDLFRVAATGGRLENLTDSFDRSVVNHSWPPGGDLLFAAAMGTDTHLFTVHSNGAIEQLTRDGLCVGSFDAARADGDLYYIAESGSEAPELWRISDSRPQRLTDINAHTRLWKWGRQQVIRWTAPDGLAVEGLLVYPADYEEGRRYPLIVDLAGGLSSRVQNRFDQPGGYQLFAAQGYVVLAVNFRGSTGYGEDFATARRADLAGGDLVDVLSGIDHVIALGVADSSRAALYGGTTGPYGAYLTTWAITQTARFDAAVTTYGLSFDPASSPARELAPEQAMYAAGYLDVLERERSPLESMANVQAPLLILEGEQGALISRAQRTYQALTELRRHVELEVLSGAGHRQITPQVHTDLFFRQLRWFDRYFKFGGADLFDFYLTGEWVPGPGGWRLQAADATPRSDYSGLRPESGRYLQVTVTLRPDPASVHAGSTLPLQLDAPDAVALLGPDGSTRPFAGTATALFGHETLIMGEPGSINISVPEGEAPTAVTVRLAFEIPDEAGEYRLRVTGFVPVRIWVPANEELQ